jgi:hypothetical protein
VDERDFERAPGAALDDHLGGSVVRVVDHDQLGVDARERLVEVVDEGADDCLLVARRRDDRQLRDARLRDGRPCAMGRGPTGGVLLSFSHVSPS